MAPKLSDSEKSKIVELYRHPDESTATLASRYGISSSTVSRILKQALSDSEYKEIVKHKKGGGSKPQAKTKTKTKSSVSKSETKGTKEVSTVSVSDTSTNKNKGQEDSLETVDAKSAPANETTPGSQTSKGSRKRTSAKGQQSDGLQQLSLADMPPPPVLAKNKSQVEQQNEQQEAPDINNSWEEEIASDLLDIDDLNDEDLDDDDIDDVLDDDDIDEDDFSDVEDEDIGDEELDYSLSIGEVLSVLPFSEAKLPRTCYIIIDRAAELITRPLKAFSELGEVPEADVDERTLPIFENHRVAKRFVNRRTQRIVKLPDAQLLRKTSTYLMDKGITRLLLSGQIYTLVDDEAEEYDYEN